MYVLCSTLCHYYLLLFVRKRIRKLIVRRSEGFVKGGDETSKSAGK
jgi:hypothetical protein